MLLHEQVLKPGNATAIESETLRMQALATQDFLAGDRLTYSCKSFVSLINMQEIQHEHL
ncbi:MAG: hypothetical protein V7731_05475 [Amphritea sp.]